MVQGVPTILEYSQRTSKQVVLCFRLGSSSGRVGSWFSSLFFSDRWSGVHLPLANFKQFHSRERSISNFPSGLTRNNYITQLWRTWLLIAYSNERWLCYTNSQYITTFLWNGLENLRFELGSERVTGNGRLHQAGVDSASQESLRLRCCNHCATLFSVEWHNSPSHPMQVVSSW